MEALRSQVRRLLQASGAYEHLEWSPPHRLFVRFNNPAYEQQQKVERAFYAQLVVPGMLVFDVGANNGSKSESFLRLGARVVAVEPDPHCARTLRRRFMLHARHEVVAAATGAAAGRGTLRISPAGSAYNSLRDGWHVDAGAQQNTVDVELITLDALIARFGRPAFCKIDVEGYEHEVLRGLSEPIDWVSFEANLPEFRDETLACVSRLRALDPDYRFNLVDDLGRGWHSARWLSSSELEARLIRDDAGYCEVFARRGTAGRG
jgi:FkbM family methyltransferase